MISSEEMADPWPPHDWQALPTETLSDGVFIRGVQLSKSIAPCSGVSGRRNRAARRHCCRIPSGVTGVGGGVFLTRCLSCSAEPRRDTRPRSHLSSSSAIRRPALQGFRLPGRHSRRAPSFLGGALVGTGGLSAPPSDYAGMSERTTHYARRQRLRSLRHSTDSQHFW